MVLVDSATMSRLVPIIYEFVENFLSFLSQEERRPCPLSIIFMLSDAEFEKGNNL